MRFDALGASIRDVEAGFVAHTLRRELGGILARGKPQKRCSVVLNIDVGSRTAAWVGFDEVNGIVYVEGKGETTPDLVAAVRGHFPGHSAPRLDVCDDYRGPGAFQQLQAVVRAAAMRKARGSAPKLGYTAFPDDPVAGATWGSLIRGGVAYLRIYEPGKMKERVHLGPDAVRVELECRPHSAAEKRAAASMTPLEVWGMAGWTQRVAEALCGVDVPRYLAPFSPYTQERSMLYIARTFRKTLEGALEEHGDWECVGREFAEVWRLDDEVKAVLKR